MTDTGYTFVPNDFEKAIIDYDRNTIKSFLLNPAAMEKLGYPEEELPAMRQAFFGISLTHFPKLDNFEKAVISEDEPTIKRFLKYYASHKEAIAQEGYKENELKALNYRMFSKNYQPYTSSADYYEIASRLYHIQKNRNQATEYYCKKYIQMPEDEEKFKKALDILCRIYINTENGSMQRMNDFLELINSYPHAKEAAQFNRSFYIECLYEEGSDQSYSEIYDIGNSCEANEFSLEARAKYIYAIILAKRRSKNSLNYFIKHRLYNLTNTVLMKEWLTYSLQALKDRLADSEKAPEIMQILQTMATKAASNKGNAAYDIVLLINREFGSGIGVDYDSLEQLYLENREGEKPFESTGWGTYLYAMAEEYIRRNGSLADFRYLTDYNQLRIMHHNHLVQAFEVLFLMKGSADYVHIRHTITKFNKSMITGIGKKRFLSFWPELEQDVADRYEGIIESYIKKLSAECNSSYSFWFRFKLNECLNITAEEASEIFLQDISEAAYYAYKKIMQNPEDCKECWYLLARIYYDRLKRITDRLRALTDLQEKETLLQELTVMAKYAYLCLYYRAHSSFHYDDWMDLNHYCFELCNINFNKIDRKFSFEWNVEWKKQAYVTYLEVFQYLQDDPEKAGKHFHDLWIKKGGRNGDIFHCLKGDLSLAKKYIQTFAELYDRFHQYRYVKFAYFIAENTGLYQAYLQLFGKTLIRSEIIQLNKQIFFFLRTERLDLVELYFKEISERVIALPELLEVTKELSDVYGLQQVPTWVKKAEKLLVLYPSSTETFKGEYWNTRTEEELYDNIAALQFVIRVYEKSKQYIQNLDLGFLYHKLFVQYLTLSGRGLTGKEQQTELIKHMYEALYLAAESGGYLPYCYELVVLCYRYYDVLIDKRSEALNITLKYPELSARVSYYEENLFILHQEIGETHKAFFEKLCEFSLNFNFRSLYKIKELIKCFYKDGTLLKNSVISSYFAFFENIDLAIIQLYFEPNNIEVGQITDRELEPFPKAYDIITMWQQSKEEGTILLSEELFSRCIFERVDKMADVSLTSVRSLLIMDYLEHSNEYSKKSMKFLYLYFNLYKNGARSNIYPIIDSINAKFGYRDERCYQFLEGLYQVSHDLKCYNSIARQYAKAGNFEEAVNYYQRVEDYASKEEDLAKQYEYVVWQKLAVILLNRAVQGEEIHLSAIKNTNPLLICQALAYNCYKNPKYIDSLLHNLVSEKDKLLLSYIMKLIPTDKADRDEEEPREDHVKGKQKYKSKKTDACDELLEELRGLKDTEYFELLLVNLYQTSLELLNIDLFDEAERQTLQGSNHKPLVQLIGQRNQARRRFVLQGAISPEELVYSDLDPIPEGYISAAMNSYTQEELDSLFTDILPYLEKSDQEKKQLIANFLIRDSQDSLALEELEDEDRKTIHRFQVELGYILFQKHYQKAMVADREKENILEYYKQAMNYLHETILLMGNEKADYQELSGRLRSGYIDMLHDLANFDLDYLLGRMMKITYDIGKLTRVFFNPNNQDSIFLREFLQAVYMLNTYVDLDSDKKKMEVLEGCIALLTTLNLKDYRYISISFLWKKLLSGKLLSLRSLTTIKDPQYLIGRNSDSFDYISLFRRITGERKSIRISALRGMGLSSVLHCYFDHHFVEGIKRNALILFLDCAKTLKTLDGNQLLKQITNVLDQSIERVSDYNKDWGKELEEAKRENILDSLESISYTQQISRIYLVVDHFEKLVEAKDRENIFEVLRKVYDRKVNLVIASDIEVDIPGLSMDAIELEPFSMEETKQYINNRMVKFGLVPEDGMMEKVYDITGGVPSLVAFFTDNLRSNLDNTNKGSFISNLFERAGDLFARWEELMDETKLTKITSKAFLYYYKIISKRSHLGTELILGQVETGKLADIKIYDLIGEMHEDIKKLGYQYQVGKKEMLERQDKMFERQELMIEGQEQIIEGNETIITAVKENSDMIAKEVLPLLRYALEQIKALPAKGTFPRDPEAEEQIILTDYASTVKDEIVDWMETADINKKRYSLSELIWDELSKHSAVYQYLKYGEAMRKLEGLITSEDYDYSVLALFYCLAMEKLMNEVFFDYLKLVIPEVEYNKRKVKDYTKDFTLGNYVIFFRNNTKAFASYATPVKSEAIKYLAKLLDFIKDLEIVKDIRNKVAHSNETVKKEEYQDVLYYMFGDKSITKDNPDFRPLLERMFELKN